MAKSAKGRPAQNSPDPGRPSSSKTVVMAHVRFRPIAGIRRRKKKVELAIAKILGETPLKPLQEAAHGVYPQDSDPGCRDRKLTG